MNIGVIGVGAMGKHHVRSYAKIPGVKIVAITDVDSDVLSRIGEKYHVRTYKDFNKMLADETLDAVSVCVPTSLHYAITKACLEKNIHVLVEKPIASTVLEAEKLVLIAKKRNVLLLVGHIERFNPAVVKVKEIVEKGQLGKIIAVTCRRLGGFPPRIKDANIAVDLAIHDIDIANYLLGELPKRVVVNKQKYHIEKREDAVEFFLKYKKTSVYIQANWISPVKIRKLNITGTEGYLELDYITQKIDFYKSNYSKFKEASKDFSDYILLFSEPDKITVSVAKKEPLREEILFFIQAIKQKKLLSPSYAVDALRIASTS